jgi:hypothetical protein
MKIDRGGSGWIIFIVSCLIALVFLISALVGAAQAQHSGHRPQDMELHHKFYNSWNMPDNRAISCCHDQDCRPAEARMVNGQWMARQEGDDGDFTPIPPNKVETERDTPDGRNHLCGRRNSPHDFTTFCFIAGAGG